MNLTALPPLALAIPLAAAALLAPLTSLHAKGRFIDAAALSIAMAVAGISITMLIVTAEGPIIHWFGGWQPLHGRACGAVPCAIGVDFVVDPLSAGMTSLASVLVIAALLFAWRYFDQVGTMFHVLVLTFLAGMVGFAMSGDIFDMFVFFEVMSVSAFALTAYRVEEKGPIPGALNFAVTNSVGAYLLLTGIALLYAQTGALNLIQIGATLRGHLDAAVVTAWVLVLVGFLVKAAIVPFHFWLADAHAAAPTPACLIFSGAMVELALYAVARIQWTVFAPVFGSQPRAVELTFLALGVVTAIFGAVMCLVQHHIKRLLAYSTVCHAGLFLCALSLLTPLGVAAAGVYILGHGLVKASLFVGAGILVHRFQHADERFLHGRGAKARMVGTGSLFIAGGLALAGLPPFLTYMGKGMSEDAALGVHLAWLPAVFVVASALTGGAVLRFAGHVFLGFGTPAPEEASERTAGEEEETGHEERRTPATMAVPMGGLLGLAAAAGLLPELFHQATAAAAKLLATGRWTAVVLGGAAPASIAPLRPLPSTAPTLFDVGTGAAAAAGAVLVAALAIGRRNWPPILAAAWQGWQPALRAMRRMQSGDVRDYLTWLLLGAGALGVSLSLAMLH